MRRHDYSQEAVQNRSVAYHLTGRNGRSATPPQLHANLIQTRQKEPPLPQTINNTGLPDQLKTGIEHLSGYTMDDVRVHYNSSEPAKLQAHAYAQGSDIHLANGQEKHLPHEAWHVVQQKQGRVQPTRQLKSIDINDDDHLEKEADQMGAKATQLKTFESISKGQGGFRTMRMAHGRVAQLEIDAYKGQGSKQLRKASIAADIRAALAFINQGNANQIAAKFHSDLASEANVTTILGTIVGLFTHPDTAAINEDGIKQNLNTRPPVDILRLCTNGIRGARWGHEDKPKTLESLVALFGYGSQPVELTWYDGNKEIKDAGGNNYSYLAMLNVVVHGKQWGAIHLHYKNNQNFDNAANIYRIHFKPSHNSDNRSIIADQVIINASQAIVDNKNAGDFPDWNNYNVAV
ncbi:MAG: DUF4157 domain-containing protein [Roseivirga sp.]|nr:DUF4157 domain-containing protein [Roseivirga sp.]